MPSFLFVPGQVIQNLLGIYASGSAGKSPSFYTPSGRVGGKYKIRAVFAGSSLLNEMCSLGEVRCPFLCVLVDT